jgi:hypothetical protein
MVERDDALVDVENLPTHTRSAGKIWGQARETFHLSHLIDVLPIRPLSILGRDPPDRAIVNLPFLSIESFWALATNAARDWMSASLDSNELTMGAEGAW